MPLSEACRRGLCKSCVQVWTPGHRGDAQSLRNIVSSRMRNGENRTHIISDLVSSLTATEFSHVDDVHADHQETNLADEELVGLNNGIDNMNIEQEEMEYEDQDHSSYMAGFQTPSLTLIVRILVWATNN